jgi:hypothetical protein
VIADSTENLQADRLQAAFDACLRGLALDTTYIPRYPRIAEIITGQRQIRRARAHR